MCNQHYVFFVKMLIKSNEKYPMVLTQVVQSKKNSNGFKGAVLSIFVFHRKFCKQNCNKKQKYGHISWFFKTKGAGNFHDQNHLFVSLWILKAMRIIQALQKHLQLKFKVLVRQKMFKKFQRLLNNLQVFKLVQKKYYNIDVSVEIQSHFSMKLQKYNLLQKLLII